MSLTSALPASVPRCACLATPTLLPRMLGRTLLGMSSSRRIGQSLRVLGGASAATAAAAGFGAATTSVVHASDGQGVGGGMWVAAATAAGVLSSTVAGPAGAAAMVAAGAGGVIATPVPHPRAVVVAGPSGVGKGTMIEKLQKDMPGTFGFSVSHATRKPRPKEVDGKDYHFVTVRALSLGQRRAGSGGRMGEGRGLGVWLIRWGRAVRRWSRWRRPSRRANSSSTPRCTAGTTALPSRASPTSATPARFAHTRSPPFSRL